MSLIQAQAYLRSFCSPVVLALLSLLLFSACEKAPAPPREAPAQPTNAVSETRAVRPEYAKLVGKWERPDGGYVLEITSVDADGTLAAGYYNPSPINISKARAIQDSEGTKVFVELRDVNYPGCTYSLKYDPQTDQLYGQYYQAALGQTYDVTFGRIKE